MQNAEMHDAECPSDSVALLTVAVPTFNRAGLLTEALDSILAQEGVDFRVVVFDNGSTDDTASVVAQLADSRVSVDRSPENVGMLRNWNRCIRFNTSKYLCVFCDDDLMRPGFLAESVRLLDVHPDVGFCFSRFEIIDEAGNTVSNNLRDVPDGVMDGLAFLEHMVGDYPGTMYPSTVVYRASTLAEVGELFDSPHSTFFDTRLWFRMARTCSVGHLKGRLVAVREHPGQVSEELWRTGRAVGQIGLLAERMDVIAFLLETRRAGDESYRHWLAERLQALLRQQTASVHVNLPSSYFSWDERVANAKEDVRLAVPAGSGVIVVDECEWGLGADLDGRRVWPFTEHEGVYWGLPAPGAEVAELERLRAAGAEFIAFAWTELPWLEFYKDLNRYLRGRRCVLRTSRVVIYSLTGPTELGIDASSRDRDTLSACPT